MIKNEELERMKATEKANRLRDKRRANRENIQKKREKTIFPPP